MARVYLALLRGGMSSAKAVSKVSGVTRQDVYRVMPKLQQKGLVSRTLTVPAMFKATPIQDGISILLNHKIKNVSEASQEAKELIKKFKGRDAKNESQEWGRQFLLLPGKEVLIRRLKKSVENARSSIDVICPKEAFPKGLLTMAEEYEKAMRRSVNIRWILEEPKDRNAWPEILQTFTKNPFFKLRFLPKSPGTRLGMYDKKEVFIATLPTMAALESSALWTNNPSTLKLVQDYFEILWITAIENQHEEPNYKRSFPAQMQV